MIGKENLKNTSYTFTHCRGFTSQAFGSPTVSGRTLEWFMQETTWGKMNSKRFSLACVWQCCLVEQLWNALRSSNSFRISVRNIECSFIHSKSGCQASTMCQWPKTPLKPRESSSPKRSLNDHNDDDNNKTDRTFFAFAASPTRGFPLCCFLHYRIGLFGSL